MAENIVLSATLELKDQMTAGLTKTKYALSGVAGELKKTSASSEALKKSLSGIKGDYKATVSARDEATSVISKIRTSLSGLAGKTYTNVISAKDNATEKVARVKSELSGIAGKTYTAILNVKSNMPPGGLNLGGKLNEVTGGVVGTSMQMAAGAGITFGVYDAIKSYMDFEKEMSAVKATSGATSEEFAQLTQKAVQMGADTKFSATEAAQAFQFMAQAGWKTQDMLDGISGIMDLSAASGEDLASVSDIVTDALTAFGLKAKDSAMFSDVLAQAAASSNTDVGKMGYSFKYAAPLAGQLGYSIQDVAVALGLMANAGVKSETAGTSLRSLFTRLADPPKDCAEEMSKLGISLTDSAGKIKPFRQLMEEMRVSFEKLSPAERLAAASALAGQDGMSGLLAIVGASQEDFDSLTNSIDNSAGAADRMAKIRMDNLAGDIEYLSGDWDALMMKFTSGAASSGLRSLVQELDSIVSHFSDAIDDGFQFSDVISTVGKVVQDLFNKFIALDGVGSVLAGGALVGGLIKIYQLTRRIGNGIKSLNGIVNDIRGFKTDLPTGSSKTGATASVKSMIVNATSVVVNGKSTGGTAKGGSAGTILGPNGKPLPPSATTTAKAAPKSILGNLGDGAKWLGSHAKGVGGAMLGIGAVTGAYNIYNAGEGQRAETAGSVVGGLGGGLAGAKLGAMAGGAIGSVVPVVGTAVGAGIGGLLGGIGGSMLGDSIGSDIGAALGKIDLSGFRNSVNETIEWMKNGFNNNVEYIGNVFSNLGTSLGESISNAMSAIGTVLSNVGEGIYNSILAPLGNIGIDLINILVGAGDIIVEALTPAFQAIGETIYTNLIQPLMDGFNVFSEYLQEIYTSITDSINTNLIEPVSSNIYVLSYNISEAFNQASAWVQSAWAGVSSWFDSAVWQPLSNNANALCNAVSNFFSSCWSTVESIWSAASSFFSALFDAIASAARSACDMISSAFSGAVGAVKSAWSGIVDWFTSNIYEPLASKARSIMSVVNSVKNRGQSITGLIPEFGIGLGLGHNATGTMSWEGGLTEINERGGEIVDLPTGSRIYPAQTTQRIIEKQLSENNTPTNAPMITITGNTFTVREDADIDKIAYKLFDLFNQSSLNYGGGY